MHAPWRRTSPNTLACYRVNCALSPPNTLFCCRVNSALSPPNTLACCRVYSALSPQNTLACCRVYSALSPPNTLSVVGFTLHCPLPTHSPVIRFTLHYPLPSLLARNHKHLPWNYSPILQMKKIQLIVKIIDMWLVGWRGAIIIRRHDLQCDIQVGKIL